MMSLYLKINTMMLRSLSMARYNDSADYNTTVPASNIVYGYYIKKVTLRHLIYKAFHGTPNETATQIRVFIDINNIMKSIMYSNCLVYNNYEVACAIVNMIAHYKSFFISGNYGVMPEFYLMYCPDYIGDIEMKRNPDYCLQTRNTIYNVNNTGKRNVLIQNIAMVKLITQYIPNAHFIENNRISTPVMMYNLIESFGDNIPNIVISKDVACNQLPVISNTTILRPKKSKTGNPDNPSMDTSYIINSMNAILYTIDKMPADTTVNKLRAVPPTYWSLLFTLNGMKSNSVQGVYEIRKAINILSSNTPIIGAIPMCGIVDNLKLPEADDMRAVLRVLNRNFDSIDIPFKNGVFKASNQAALVIPPTLFDNNGLKTINDTYFNSKGLFIDLMTLLS